MRWTSQDTTRYLGSSADVRARVNVLRRRINKVNAMPVGTGSSADRRRQSQDIRALRALGFRGYR